VGVIFPFTVIREKHTMKRMDYSFFNGMAYAVLVAVPVIT
jgi:hypothetical protein